MRSLALFGAIDSYATRSQPKTTRNPGGLRVQWTSHTYDRGAPLSAEPGKPGRGIRALRVRTKPQTLEPAPVSTGEGSRDLRGAPPQTAGVSLPS